MKAQHIILRFCCFYLALIYFETQAANITMSKCYGGTLGESAYDIFATSDGGYLIVGETGSMDGDVVGAHCYYDSASGNCYPFRDMWVIKTDLNGNLLWQKCLGGTDTDGGVAGMEVAGGYVITGHSGSTDGDATFNNGLTDFWIVKIDFTGNLIWQHSYGGDNIEDVHGIAQGINGEIIGIGYTNSENTGDVTGFHGTVNRDIWLIKCDSAGFLIWQKCLGSTSTDDYSIVGTDYLGNIFVVCTTGSNNGDVNCNINGKEVWLCKIDTAGIIVWQNCFGGGGGDFIYTVKIHNDRIYLAGRTSSNNGDLSHNYGYTDAWILVVDTSGNLIFSKSYGGSLTDGFYGIDLTTDNHIVAVGKTMSSDYDVTMNYPGFNNVDAWVVITDSAGNLLWQNTYGGSRQDELLSVFALSNNRILFAGNTNTPNDGDIVDYHGNTAAQLWIGQLDSIVTNINSQVLQNLVQVYPNPFSEQLNIILKNGEEIKHVELLNIQGKITSSKCENLNNKANISLNCGNAPGLYIIKVITNENTYYLKAIKS